jgi:uncharacterized protein YbjT (DUF2867 family)
MTEIKGKVLLTGATGFVGGRLLHGLTGHGMQVRCLVRSPERLRPNLFAEEEIGGLLSGSFHGRSHHR